MPSSSARWIVAIDSSSSVSPYQADMPMQPRPCSETASPCPSVRVSMEAAYFSAIVAAGHGRPQAENLEVAPRQAPRDARDQRAERQRLPAVRAAEAAAPRLPDLRHVQGPRGRAAPLRRSRRSMTRIAVDAMGGDRGPAEIVAGALEARSDGIEIVLFGDPSIDAHGLELQPTSDVIGMHEKPAEAVRAKPDSSLVASVRAVAEGAADAVVSAGNTGAMLAAGLLELRRIPGVMRPAIAVPIPAERGPSVLLDIGANADARAGAPASVRARWARSSQRRSSKSTNPEVRLLSIGEEPEKGNQLVPRGPRAAARERPQLQGQHRGAGPPPRRRRRRRDRRLHGQRRAQAARGDDPHHPRRFAGRDHGDADAGSSAACSSVRPRAGSAAASIPTRSAAPICSACAGSW